MRSKSLQIAATNHKLQKNQFTKKVGFKLKDAFNTLQMSTNKSQIAKVSVQKIWWTECLGMV